MRTDKLVNLKRLFRAVRNISLDTYNSFFRFFDRETLFIVARTVGLFLLVFSPFLFGVAYLAVNFGAGGIFVFMLSVPATWIWFRFVASIYDAYKKTEEVEEK